MRKHILIVGGGIGGTMTANHLVQKLYPEISAGKVEITLLSNTPWHFYKPAFMYVAFDMFHESELKRKQKTLLRPEINFCVDEVIEFQYQANTVKCKSNKSYSYDYLVISTGCIPSPERIEGLQEAGHHFYQQAASEKLAAQLRTIEKGRIFITVSFPDTPNVPHQCGIAPLETTLMLDDLLRKKGGARSNRNMLHLPNCQPTPPQLPVFTKSNLRRHARDISLPKHPP